MLNRVILIGRLTDSPELRYTGSGTAVCNFTLAVQRPFRNNNGETDTDFIDIVVWRKQGENAAEHLAKGLMCAVDGRLQVRSYETDEGYNRRVTEVVANDVRFLEYKNDNTNNPKENNDQSQEVMSEEEDLDVPF